MHSHPMSNLGREASDAEMLALYLEIIKRIPVDQCTATWIYAICLALPDGQAFCGLVELHERFTDQPSLPLLPGYPLSSLLFVPAFGKTLRDLTPEEEHQYLAPVYEKVETIILAAQQLLHTR